MSMPQHQFTQPTHAKAAIGAKKSFDYSSLELPPSAQKVAAPSCRPTRGTRSQSGAGTWKRALMLCAAVAVLAGALWHAPQGNESDAPNWKHAKAAAQGGHAMKWIGHSGPINFSHLIPLGDADCDTQTTNAVREALLEADVQRANQLFAAAQGIPPASLDLFSSVEFNSLDPGPDPQSDSTSETPPPQPKLPQATLTTGMREEILQGDARFYHIHLYDSCWNDGDVVEILLNGHSMFVVPITNAGATLTVPIQSNGATVIAVRGVRDGRGGITVACRTSQGDGFVRVMAPGEIQPLGVVLP